ncbi:MAG: hypothetical protein NT150_01575 [Bacteroidetes bacterium]|nr:hypothetical protein [Bacteroidota bacterium]
MKYPSNTNNSMLMKVTSLYNVAFKKINPHMKYKILFSFATLAFILSESASAQVLYFNGLGRAIVTNDAISGNINDNDTKTARKSTNGYTVFDLGVNVQPSEYLRAAATLRAKNAFGGFYGDGSVITFRQIKLDGIISKKVKYEIGDIDLSLSPYTLFNSFDGYYDHEADIFAQRRKIVYYENFNNGNKWRVQGANINASLVFDKGIEKIGIQGFATRIARANYFNNIVPDRLQYGGRVDVMQSKNLIAGVNYIELTDLTGTSPAPAVVLNNRVLTGDFKFNFELSNILFSLYGEGGGSNYSYTGDSTRTKQDYFYDAGVSASYKPYKLKVYANYRNVGADFNSPGAQTRRIFDQGATTLFPTYTMNSGANTFARAANLLDRASDEGTLRNTTIMDTLVQYNPMYNNITPYGLATPNRQGVTIGASIGDEEKVFKADVALNLLSEIREEVGNGSRNYQGLKGGFKFNLHKLLNLEKVITINGGVNFEHTSRTGTQNTIDLTSNTIDGGFVVEVFKSLDVLGGVKFFNATGNEFYSKRDAFNVINTATVTAWNFNYNQSVIAGGLRLRHSKNAFTTLQYNMVNINDKQNATKYAVSQLFINYTLIF